MRFNQKKFTFFIVIFCFIFSQNLKAEKAYFDLSDDTINIETNFTGKEIIIFGLTDPSHDTILILKGPNINAKLSFKERLFGIWIETKKFNYKNVPSIFFIATSSPITDILNENIIRQKGLDLNYFDNMNLNNINFNDSKIFENNLYEWNRNFIRKQEESDFYKYYKLEIVDDKLFQTRVFFPPNIVPGIYDVNILHVQNKKIINEDKKTIIIRKTGVGNKIYNFAIKEPLLYGILCIIFAVASGLFAATVFRRF